MQAIARATLVVILTAIAAACGRAGRGAYLSARLPGLPAAARTSGKVLVSGKVGVDCDRVEARFPGAWVRLPFDRRCAVVPGGNCRRRPGDKKIYRLDVRLLARASRCRHEYCACRRRRALRDRRQSNATNYGEVRQQTTSGMVSRSRRRLASGQTTRSPGVQDNSRNGSFIPAFGELCMNGTACYRGGIVGHGSTSVRQWLPRASA